MVIWGKSDRDDFVEVRERLAQLESQKDLAWVVLAGGCFWCMEGPFEELDGVVEAIAGYAGGDEANPRYDDIVRDTDGHREAIKVFYDPAKVSFRNLLMTFWLTVDPTDPGGQFIDRGEHNTAAIYYTNETEKAEAERQIEEINLSGRFEKPVVTPVLAYKNFFPAEDYHQDFYKKRAIYYKQYARGSGREDYVRAAKLWYAKHRS